MSTDVTAKSPAPAPPGRSGPAAEGKAVVFISSELPELLGMCDRIYTMAAGRLTGEVPRAEATQEVLMRQMTKDKEVTR